MGGRGGFPTHEVQSRLLVEVIRGVRLSAQAESSLNWEAPKSDDSMTCARICCPSLRFGAPPYFKCLIQAAPPTRRSRFSDTTAPRNWGNLFALFLVLCGRNYAVVCLDTVQTRGIAQTSERYATRASFAAVATNAFPLLRADRSCRTTCCSWHHYVWVRMYIYASVAAPLRR